MPERDTSIFRTMWPTFISCSSFSLTTSSVTLGSESDTDVEETAEPTMLYQLLQMSKARSL